MKLIKTASGKKKVKMSKSEWQNIGKTAGWIKVAVQNSQIKNELSEKSKVLHERFIKKYRGEINGFDTFGPGTRQFLSPEDQEWYMSTAFDSNKHISSAIEYIANMYDTEQSSPEFQKLVEGLKNANSLESFYQAFYDYKTATGIGIIPVALQDLIDQANNK